MVGGAVKMYLSLDTLHRLTNPVLPLLQASVAFTSAATAMVLTALKLYFVGTALTVLAVLYEIADSCGGLMYAQNHHLQDVEHRQRSTNNQQ